MKPQLADNWNPKKHKFPCWQQPKVDGVRGINLQGGLTGRSLDPFKNAALVERFSGDKYLGLDGELAKGDWDAPRLCSDTTSACNTTVKKGGTAEGITWWVFDLVTEATVTLPYAERYELLRARVNALNDPAIKLMPCMEVLDLEAAEAMDAVYLDMGLEGSILRNPDAPLKQGRPSSKVQELMRIKRFIDAEMRITGITEGNKNNNEAKTNTLGRTERSTHKENMEPNGMVGTIQGTLLADVKDPTTGAVLLVKGQEVTVSAGCMTHQERKIYFVNQDLLIGQISKFKLFPKGVKDLPRMPIHLSLRAPEDMG